MTEFEACNTEPFVADVTAQDSSLEAAAQAVELLAQQIEGYLQRLRAAVCTDLRTLQAELEGIVAEASFLDLTDTPDSYAGAGGEVVAVKAAEDGLEFVPVSGGGLPDLVAGVEASSGRTIDGSDSFFMLVDLGAMPNATTKNVAHGIGSTFRAINIWGAMRNPTTNDNRPLPFVSQSFATSQIAVVVDATNVILVTNFNFSAWTQGYMVIEYIKV